MQKPTTLSQQEQVSFPEPSFVPEKRPLGWSGWTMIVLIVLLLGVLISAGIGGARLGLGAMQGKAAIESAQEHALAFEFAEAGDDLALAHNAFEGARSGINWMFWMKPIPWVGDQINGVGLVLDAGIESIAALESAISIAEDVYEIVLETQALLEENNLPADVTSFSTLPPDIRGRLLSSLHNSHDRLLEMQAKLRIAQQDLAAQQDNTERKPGPACGLDRGEFRPRVTDSAKSGGNGLCALPFRGKLDRARASFTR